MKRLNCVTYAMITLFLMDLSLKADPLGTEAELQAMERELDQEQERLNQRRQALHLRKLRLELQKKGQDVPNNAESSVEEKAAQLAQLRANAEAEKFRSIWIAERQKLKDLQESLKTEKKMGSPKAIGKKAKEKEEVTAKTRSQTDAQIKEFEKHILTSMQTTLQGKGTLSEAELKWLESLVAEPEDKEEAPVIDEATLRWANLIMEMANAGKKTGSGKTTSVLGE